MAASSPAARRVAIGKSDTASRSARARRCDHARAGDQNGDDLEQVDRRPERPDLTRIPVIRFLTETDYPPFNYAGPDGAPAGFNVELARLICEEIKVACTVQMRRFDTLVSALNSNTGDAVIASGLAKVPELP